MCVGSHDQLMLRSCDMWTAVCSHVAPRGTDSAPPHIFCRIWCMSAIREVVKSLINAGNSNWESLTEHVNAPWGIKLHLMLGCTPVTPEFPMLSVWNNFPHPSSTPPHSTSISPSMQFSFHCHLYPVTPLSIPSPSFLHFHSPAWVLRFDHLPRPPSLPLLLQSAFLVLSQ